MATRYVRPDTTHSGTRDGLTYATAWGGWSEIVWGGAGVKGGDELYVCGTHTYASGISVGAHTGTVNAPCTIRGDYATAPGSIIFSPTLTNTLTVGVANTIILGFTSLAAITHNGAATNTRYLYNIFNTPGSTSAIRFSASGDNHADIVIRGNTFNTSSPSTNHAALRWWVQTGANSSMTRATIEENTFNTASNRSVIEFRTQTDSHVNAKMTDIKINYNTFTGCAGTCIELTCPGTTNTAGQARGCQIKGNNMSNVIEVGTAPNNFGGGIGVFGFDKSITTGFGENIISDNQATNLQGPTGLVDTFYGTYIIQDNVGDGFTTTTIDANGILLDIGTYNTIVRRNKISNIVGKAGVFNSGCGVMILGKCTNNFVYNNVFDNCRNGLFIGDTAGACDVKVYNNVFTNCTDSGVITTSTASLINNVLCLNNLFSGTGYSVKNQMISPLTPWTRENFNMFLGFTSGEQNHTLGQRSKKFQTTNASAAYSNAKSLGMDPTVLATMLTLPVTLLQLN